MSARKNFVFGLSVAVLGFALLLTLLAVTPVSAQEPTPGVDNGNCIKCHDDLYFNHDTGNWFCIRESPMPCVDCHGGDPTATTKESAHYDRSAHPIVNEDISVCRNCHVEGYVDCVSKFDQVAGIKEVKQASPILITHAPDRARSLLAIQKQEPVNWPLLLDILVAFVVISLALTFFAIKKNDSRK